MSAYKQKSLNSVSGMEDIRNQDSSLTIGRRKMKTRTAKRDCWTDTNLVSLTKGEQGA